MQDEDSLAVMAIEDAAGRLNNLAIARPFEFLGPAAAFWVVCQLPDVSYNPLDQLSGSGGVLQCNVVGNSI